MNKIQYQELKFQAQLHGAKIEEPVGMVKETTNDNMVFKDPSEYDHMSKEEKDALTDKMLSRWKSWSSNALKG